MSYRIAGIDVHKKMLAVPDARGCYRNGVAQMRIRIQLRRRPPPESTAQYWQPVWGALERYWKPSCQKREGAGPKWGTLHLAQAQSNRGPRGRKKDFPALLEEAHIKLSSLVSDLLGISARRMLKALVDGGTDPAALAALADKNLRATQAQLRDALGACAELKPVYRRLLKMFLEELQLIEQQIGQLEQEMASLLSQHHEAVQRLAELPGLGVDSAQQIIAEVGATAATVPSGKQLSSWVGACPGDEESAEVSRSHRSRKVTATCAHSQSIC